MDNCRSCKSKDIEDLFTLGPMPLVNHFIGAEEVIDEPLYELDLKYCQECHLVQLGTTVPPEKLYREYHHLSSASKTNIDHLQSVAEYFDKTVNDCHSKKILEIGSNDGSLLENLSKVFLFALGVDPAKKTSSAC